MAIDQELSELANAVSEVAARAHESTFSRQLSALASICAGAARAWSGSNIGYHATVYYVGLRPKPADTQFSPEWGLMDRWPTHEPDRGWQIMDSEVVITELLSRAKIADKRELEDTISELQSTLSLLKEQAISMLSTSLLDQSDSFLIRQRKKIEDIHVTSPQEIAGTLLPHNAWSRDSLALSQGITLAPHQQLGAIATAGDLTKKGLEALEYAVRLSASHIQRNTLMQTPENTAKNVVIGHGRSHQWLELKDFIKDRLRLSYDEFNRVPVAGLPNTVRLTQMLNNAAIAFIVLTGEDEQKDGITRARQNVIHETGLFQGRLGFSRGIVLIEDGCEQFSNIEGLGQIRFPKGHITAAFEEIRRVLEREDIIKS